MVVSSGPLRIGGNALWDEFFAGRIDDVRVYNRALTAAEVLADMNTPVAGADTQAPSAPGGLTATVTDVKLVDLAWTAATDDRGVTGYRIYRSETPDFTPSAATLRTTITGTSWRDDSLTTSGNRYYKVIAARRRRQRRPAAEATAVLPLDTTPPTVSIASPTEGQGLSRIVPVSTSKSDDWGVVNTKLQIDGGTPVTLDLLVPKWDTNSVPDGPHELVVQRHRRGRQRRRLRAGERDRGQRRPRRSP